MVKVGGASLKKGSAGIPNHDWTSEHSVTGSGRTSPPQFSDTIANLRLARILANYASRNSRTQQGTKREIPACKL